MGVRVVCDVCGVCGMCGARVWSECVVRVCGVECGT